VPCPPVEPGHETEPFAMEADHDDTALGLEAQVEGDDGQQLGRPGQ
jgi:hypothetical protein